jgi:hypothetical protein
MNAALAIVGSVVAGPLRAAHEVDSLSDSLFVFFYLTVVIVVEARLCTTVRGFLLPDLPLRKRTKSKDMHMARMTRQTLKEAALRVSLQIGRRLWQLRVAT